MKTPIFTFLLFFLCAPSLKAQLKNFEVSEMPRPDVPIVQANLKFPDDALIIVYSSFDNLSFRSSIVAVDKQYYNAQANRYEILVKPIKQMIFISASDFMEQKLGTINPKPKEDYYYKVEEQKTELVNQTAPGTLTINSNPSGANISLNGISITNKTPFTGELNPGSTRVQLSKTKYQTFDTLISVRSSINELLAVNLMPTTLWLNIKSNPASAQVELDGIDIGKTPLSKELDLSDKSKQGERFLKLSYPDYDDLNQTIQLYPSKDPMSINVDLKKTLGDYRIESIPDGAQVFIDGDYKGQTPLQGTLPIGSYSVELKMEEYLPSLNKQLIVNVNEIAKLSFELKLINQYTDSNNSSISKNGLVQVTGEEKKTIKKYLELGVSNSNLNFDSNGKKSQLIKVFTNESSYSVPAIFLPYWCSVVTYDDYFIVTASANLNNTNRKDWFKVIAGNEEVKINVEQSAGSSSISKENLRTSSNNEESKSPKQTTKCFNCPKTDDEWGVTFGVVPNSIEDAIVGSTEIGIKHEQLFKYGFGLNTGINFEGYSPNVFDKQIFKDGFNLYGVNLPFQLEYRLNFSKWFNVYAFGGYGYNSIFNYNFKENSSQLTYETGAGFRVNHLQFSIGSSSKAMNISDNQNLSQYNNSNQRIKFFASYMF
jgi:hypothetical protein